MSYAQQQSKITKSVKAEVKSVAEKIDTDPIVDVVKEGAPDLGTSKKKSASAVSKVSKAKALTEMKKSKAKVEKGKEKVHKTQQSGNLIPEATRTAEETSLPISENKVVENIATDQVVSSGDTVSKAEKRRAHKKHVDKLYDITDNSPGYEIDDFKYIEQMEKKLFTPVANPTQPSDYGFEAFQGHKRFNRKIRNTAVGGQTQINPRIKRSIETGVLFGRQEFSKDKKDVIRGEIDAFNNLKKVGKDKEAPTKRGLNIDQLMEGNAREQLFLLTGNMRESATKYGKEASKNLQRISRSDQSGGIELASGRYQAGFERREYIDKSNKVREQDYEYFNGTENRIDADAIYYNFSNKKSEDAGVDKKSLDTHDNNRFRSFRLRVKY